MMKKRILALCMAGAMAITLSACGGAAPRLPQLTTEEASSAVSGGEEKTAKKPNSADYENTLLGLCSYMEDGKAVVKDEEAVAFENGKVVFKKDSVTTFVEMSYKEIGAIGGYRYQFAYNGSTVQAEFYEFAPENLDEKGKACLDSVREKGFFQVLDIRIQKNTKRPWRIKCLRKCFSYAYINKNAQGLAAMQAFFGALVVSS